MKSFEDKLKDIYLEEKKMSKTVSDIIESATSPALITALKDYLEKSNQLVENLEQIFARLEKNAAERHSEEMEELVKEAIEIMESHESCTNRHAGNSSTTQDIKYLEFATYETISQFDVTLDLFKAFTLLAAKLEEEKSVEEMLSKLDNATINIEEIEAFKDFSSKNI
ncbi:MAG: DUF892 family protein [Cyclobacteriaceae bacterium]|nr:DUF892 family protein [Cyclobacteriaceae bacterium]